MVDTKRIGLKIFQYGRSDGMAIEKEINGVKRRYLVGVATGSKKDEDGENLTENCIKSIIKQMQEKDILLYVPIADMHQGLDSYEDIGILENFYQKDDGDIVTEFRLYDTLDKFSETKLSKVDSVWRQQKGLPPYKHPKQRGFSIDGQATLLSRQGRNLGDGNFTGREIDDMNIDHIVLVDKPAYNSLATAVAKAMNEPTRAQKEKTLGIFWSQMAEVAGLNSVQKQEGSSLSDTLVRSLETKEKEGMYREKKWELEEVFDDQVRGIMSSKSAGKEGRLQLLFGEYAKLMIPLIVASEEVFLQDKQDKNIQIVEKKTDEKAANAVQQLLDNLGAKMRSLLASIGEQKV